jgi:aspartate aminotransferase
MSHTGPVVCYFWLNSEFCLLASGIREVMAMSVKMDEEDPLHPVIRLEVGQPNFATPPHVVDATIQALRDGHTAYGPSNGTLALRQAIVDRFNSDGFATNLNQIVVTVGSSLSLFSLLATILHRGDECLLPIPGFPNYMSAISLLGGKSVPYLCSPENGYLPTLETVKSSCTQNTKCLIICNPGNPTGSCYSKELLQEIILWAHGKGIFVISDGKPFVLIL